MAEENQETKLPQGQIGHESTVLPPSRARKTTWPEVVGLPAEEAERKIKEEMPGVRIQVVPPNCFVTMDFNQQRVRLHVDSSGKVARPPKIG
ncbi:unnamed protein product [Camellia sinensis]